MRTHQKPDLLLIIIVFVGIGVALSSYIQHLRANPTPVDVTVPAVELPVAQLNSRPNELILVSTPIHTELLFKDAFNDDNGVVVNKSLQQP